MKKTKVLILGANGMLGHKLFLHLSKYENLLVNATVRNADVLLKNLSQDLMKNLQLNVDVSNFASIIKVIEDTGPDWVINCIGLVKQGPLAFDPIANISINALLPHKIAQVCHTNNAHLLHISTDCVFSGKKGFYSETDLPDGLDLYGRTKALGEVNTPHCLTIRTSIIGHELQTQLGLVEWFLAQEQPIQGYKQHIFSGFPTIELAHIIARHIIPNAWLSGVYHLSSEPISKYELLKQIAAQYQRTITIEPNEKTICDRSLDSRRLRELIGYSPPPWPDLINKMYQDYLLTPLYQKIGGI